jgi:hypothetical protein
LFAPRQYLEGLGLEDDKDALHAVKAFRDGSERGALRKDTPGHKTAKVCVTLTLQLAVAGADEEEELDDAAIEEMEEEEEADAEAVEEEEVEEEDNEEEEEEDDDDDDEKEEPKEPKDVCRPWYKKANPAEDERKRRRAEERRRRRTERLRRGYAKRRAVRKAWYPWGFTDFDEWDVALPTYFKKDDWWILDSEGASGARPCPHPPCQLCCRASPLVVTSWAIDQCRRMRVLPLSVTILRLMPERSGDEYDEEEELKGIGVASDDEGDDSEGGAVLTLADVKPAIQAWAFRAGVGTRIGAGP